MTAYTATRGRRTGVWFLLTLILALASRGQAAWAGQPEDERAEAKTGAAISARSRQDSEDAEEEMIEIDPLLRLQLLSSILITSPDVLKNTSTSGVTLAPFTSQTTGDEGGDGGIQGGKTPTAPEPASLVLGAVGAGLAMLMTAVRRRRRRAAAAA